MLNKKKKIRYAVVGLGHIAQVAVLPAFKAAARNSELVALVTGDPQKERRLAKKYKIKKTFSYDAFDELLKSGEVDALYICLPNHRHAEFAIPALEAGLHVLCEKPLALTEEDGRRMDRAARQNGVKLMTAYRLHFEPANLDALKLVKAGKLGDLRYFTSDFSYQITDLKNIRLKSEDGGGAIWDIGIYCINAARTLMRSEPDEVFAYQSRRPGDARFVEVPESFAVTLKFPDDRFASFCCSFGADTAAQYQLRGTKGSILVDDAYEYATPRRLYFLKDGKVKLSKSYKKADQFAPEILYFSECVLTGQDPEPSAQEGLNDVKVILAAIESARTGKPVKIRGASPHVGPNSGMKKKIKGHAEPELVNATGASS